MIESTKTIFKHSTLYSIGNLMRKLSGVIILPLIQTYLTEEEFGVYTLLETVFLFVLALSGWGVKSGFSRWYHDMASDKDRKSLFFTVGVFNYSVSTLMTVLMGIILYNFSVPFLKYELSARVIILFSLSGLFRLMYDLPFVVLRLQQRVKKQTTYASLNVILLISATYIFLELDDQPFEAIYKAQFFSNIITFLLLIPLLVKNSKIRILGAQLKEMIGYGLPLAISNILTVFLSLSDRHIINQYINAAESGNYGLASKVSNLLEMVVVASFITSFTFYYYKAMNHPDMMRVFRKQQRFFLIILALAGIAITLFAPEIIWVVSGAEAYYQEGVILIPFLTLGLMFGAMRQLFTLPLNKHKKTKVISKILIIGGVINFGLNMLLVPEYGKVGAALATLFVQLISMIWFYREARKYEVVSLNLIENLKLLLVWSVFAVVTIYMPGTPWVTLHVKIVSLVGFVLCLILLKVIRRDEINELLNAIKGIFGGNKLNV